MQFPWLTSINGSPMYLPKLSKVTILSPDYEFTTNVFGWANPEGTITVHLPAESTAFTSATEIFDKVNYVVVTAIAPPPTTIVSGVGEDSGKIFVTVDTDVEIPSDCKIVLAVYDSDGALLGVYIQDTTSEAGDGNTTEYVFENIGTTNATDCKAFIWDDFQTVQPIV